MKYAVMVLLAVIVAVGTLQSASAATLYYLVRVDAQGKVIATLGVYDSLGACMAALASQPNKVRLECRAEGVQPRASWATPTPTPKPTVSSPTPSRPLSKSDLLSLIWDMMVAGTVKARISSPQRIIKESPPPGGSTACCYYYAPGRYEVTVEWQARSDAFPAGMIVNWVDFQVSVRYENVDHYGGLTPASQVFTVRLKPNGRAVVGLFIGKLRFSPFAILDKVVDVDFALRK